MGFAMSQVERSKLIQRQKKDEADAEKDVKKKKGAMKEAAQAKLEELREKNATELEEFDRAKATVVADSEVVGAASSSKADRPSDALPEHDNVVVAPATTFRVLNWNGLSKKELEEECVKRGLGKKGSKEDLVMKLILFSQEQEGKEPVETEAPLPKAPPAKAPPVRRREVGSSDEEESDEEEEADVEKAAQQYKREQYLRGALKVMVTKNPEGVSVDDLADVLAGMKVTGYAPEKFGYKTTEKLLKYQPAKLLRYDAKERMIYPPVA